MKNRKRDSFKRVGVEFDAEGNAWFWSPRNSMDRRAAKVPAHKVDAWVARAEKIVTPPPPTDHPTLPPLGATPEPSAADRQLAFKLKHDCCPIVYVGDGRHYWPLNEEIAATAIAAHVAQQTATARAALAQCEEKLRLAEAFLLKLATDGGAIVSSGECSVLEIAEAQACNRFHIVDSLGFVLRPKLPKHIVLGLGEYSVAQSTKLDGTPCLTIRRLPSPEGPGTLLEPSEPGVHLDFEVVVDVTTPASASVLLIVAQHIAFAHGIIPSDTLTAAHAKALEDSRRMDWLDENMGKVVPGSGDARFWILGQKEFAPNKATNIRAAIDAVSAPATTGKESTEQK